jgi:hypothetical protein
MSSIMAQIKKMGLAIFCFLILFFSNSNLWAWNELRLPITPGDSLGKIITWVGNEQYTVELVAANSVREKTFGKN